MACPKVLMVSWNSDGSRYNFVLHDVVALESVRDLDVTENGAQGITSYDAIVISVHLRGTDRSIAPAPRNSAERSFAANCHFGGYGLGAQKGR